MTSERSDIEKRLTAVESVGSIVSAMLALARAQLPEADAAAANATAFVDAIDEVIARLATPTSGAETRPTLTVVVGPERPLCGNLPRRVARVAAGAEGRVALVGRRTFDSHVLLGCAPVAFHVDGPSSVNDLPDVARALASAILEHGMGHDVVLCHPLQGSPQLHSSMLLGSWRVREPPVETLAPPGDVLEHAIREVTAARLQVALAETLRVEITARIVAAEGARRAAERREESLRRSLQVARHEEITAEILDLSRARKR